MKHLLIAFIIFTSISVTGQSQKTYQLDTFQSFIKWKGSYLFSFSEHNGTVLFNKGKLITTDGDITGGSFTIDMTTISNEDYLLERGPVQHLKDTDFFDVPQFPKATLVITKVEYFTNDNTHRFTADLTIKGITNQIDFIANANGTNNLITTKFLIDRTRWGIVYNNDAKNSVISDAVEFDVILQFRETSL